LYDPRTIGFSSLLAFHQRGRPPKARQSRQRPSEISNRPTARQFGNLQFVPFLFYENDATASPPIRVNRDSFHGNILPVNRGEQGGLPQH
jgi:hypothetical protein